MKISEPATHFPKPLLWSLGLLSAAILFKLFNQLNADYDLWWHIFIGKDIILKGALERYDIYSFTAAGQPYINHEWLSEIIMAGAYLLFGDAGLLLWRWSTVILIILLSFNLIRLLARHNLSRIITGLCAGVVLGPGISFRVQIFSFFFLLVLLNLIYMKRARDGFPSVYGVSLLFVFWANLHGAVVLGLLVWFVYVLEHIYLINRNNRLKVLLLSILFPTAATLINPYGPGLWKFVYHELSNPLSAKYITEWQRFAFAPREIPFFGVMVVTWASYFFSGREKGRSETVMLCIASVMGIMSVRNTPLFVILALPSMAFHFDGLLQRLLNKAGRGQRLSPIPIRICALLFVGLSVFFFIRGLPDRWEVSAGMDPIPVQTAAFLKENGFKGNLWVPLHFGGYALFHLYPDISVSIDGRWAMVYNRNIMKDSMDFSFHGTGAKWKKILEKYEADFAMVEPGNPALEEMSRDLNWVWVFHENHVGLLVKKDYLPLLPSPLKLPEKMPPAWP